jgi:hypothetical protein
MTNTMESALTPQTRNDALNSETVQSRESTVPARLALAAMALFALATWMLQHPYIGLRHDAAIYVLLALARSHPDTLATDVFLRFGSQDQYTLFSPLYSAAISLLDPEPAAAFLTFAAHVALLVCAWLVARRFMSALAATFGVALLLALPGEYGSGILFHYLEDFLTPRLPAEALVLAAVAATLNHRYWLGSLCLLAAMVLHPIMAAAGVAFLVLTFVVPARPRLTAAAAAILLVGSLTIVQTTSFLGRLDPDPDWFEIVRASSSYLYVSSWSVSDWSRVCVPLAILAIGLLAGTTRDLRRVCGGALMMVACGLPMTLLYCDLLHVILFTQVQSWRWLWLADVLAIVLTPVIAGDCWRSGTAGRVAIILLASAWSLRDDGSALYIVPVAIACAAVPAAWRNHRYARLVLFGSCALLLIAVANDLAARLAYREPQDAAAASFPYGLRALFGDGVVPAALLVAAWFGLRRTRSVQRNVLLVAMALALCAVLVPMDLPYWTPAHYTPGLARRFAPWRAEIPPHAEVLWPDNPIGAWYLLERPNYWSHIQAAGAIFSRDKSLLLRQRTASINTALLQSGLLKADFPGGNLGLVLSDASKMDARAVKTACADPDLRYVVSWLRLGRSAVAPLTPDPAKPNSRLYLYRCADFPG